MFVYLINTLSKEKNGVHFGKPTGNNGEDIFTCCCLVDKSCLTPCDPMDSSTPGFPVLHYLPEFAQIRVHWVTDAIQPSHPLSPPSLAVKLSQHLGLFHWVGSSHQVAKVRASASASVLTRNLQGSFPSVVTGLISLLFKGLSRVFSNTTVQKHQFFGPLSSLGSNSHICRWLLEKP